MKLSCTFIHNKDFYNLIQVINRDNKLDYIDIFNKYDDYDKLYLFYDNINNIHINNTIIVQKKTNLNTFFTINALNYMVKLHNSDIIPWEIYNDKLIILKNKNLSFVDLQFKLRVNLN